LLDFVNSQAHGSISYAALPVLKEVGSGEEFGLVNSAFTSSFNGLLEIKQEGDEAEGNLLVDMLPIEPEFDTKAPANILDLSAAAFTISPDRSISPMDAPASITCTAAATASNTMSSVSAGKRKATFEEDYVPESNSVGATSKRVRVESPTVESSVSLSELTKE
jgi:hypothetical protein